MSRPDVLVVGAGPVGTALALHAQRHGADVCLIERRTRLARPSRSMLLWPRTLESLHRLGVADELVAHPAARMPTQLHLGARTVDVALAELAASGRARLPLMVPQAEIESVLDRARERAGIRLATRTELVSLSREAEGVLARLRIPGGEQGLRCRYLVGSDGADSTVRGLSRIPWRGHVYAEEAVIADLRLSDLPQTAAHIGAGPAGIGFLFPAGEHGADWRLVATRRARGAGAPPGRDGPPVPVPELQGVLAGANLPGIVDDSVWSTRVRLQRRRAGRYRADRVFLVGDAAHVFSPAGAQGINTGLQDAANLGWKLAAACGGSSDPERLLSSYEAERRPVAGRVGLLTEAILHGEADERLPFLLARTRVMPVLAPLAPALLRLRPLTAIGGAVLSQDWVSYAASPITAPGTGRGPLRAGNPLPDAEAVVRGRTVRLHGLTSPPGIHVLHGAAVPARPVLGPVPVTCHELDGWPRRRIVAVRPDGYIGFRNDWADLESLDRWLGVVCCGA
ncbi:FAD-dependent oxidoreductase [Brevibacterium daeguense]|nr:FAD-dependent oxidoreductase [Brevibacterium daeguense]